MVDRHVDTLAQLGFTVDLSEINFPEKSVLSDEILTITNEKSDDNWIGIAPFAQYQTKVYPLDFMKETVKLLAENPKNKLFLFGGGEEEISKLNMLQQNLSNVKVVAGELKFIEELSLIQHLNVMLSMDSGNGHIAAMYGVPVITLWGQTHPYLGFVPFNQPIENSLTPDLEKYPFLPTSVYGNKTLKGYENVMRSILPETVVFKIIKTIDLKK